MPLQFFTNSGNSYGSAIPFQRIVEPAQLGFFLNLEQSELLRIQRYNEGWRFYFGKHWLFKREDGEPLVTFNYFRKIIDKSVEFMVAKGFVNRVPDALELVSKPFLDEVWEYNKRDQIVWDIGTTGAVTGDVFAMVTFEEPSEMQRRVNPFSQGHIRVNLLGSEQVYPTWDPLNTDVLVAARIETVYYAERGTRQLDREDRVNHEGRQLYTKRFTQIITRDQIVEQYHGDQPVIRPNVLGEIPLVHIKNLSLPKEYYGLPDGMDLIDVQRELNEKSTDISDTINYHCVDAKTEALTRDGWKKHDELNVGDEVLSLDPSTDEITWQPVEAVNVYENVGGLVEWDNRISAVTTPNHRWLVERKIGRPASKRYEREFARTSKAEGEDKSVTELREGSRVIVGGGVPACFADEREVSDELIETIGWFVTEGSYLRHPSGSLGGILSQSERVNASKVDRIRALGRHWRDQGYTFTEQKTRANGVVCWYLGTELIALMEKFSPEKSILPSLLRLLTYEQAELLLDALMAGDGTGDSYWYQDDAGRVSGFQMLAAMLGRRTYFGENNRGNGVVYLHQSRTIQALATTQRAKPVEQRATVWCPTVPTGTWLARREGFTYWTGNSAPVTAVFGAKAKQLQRGPRQIWSGLPKDARIETLKLEGDLVAAKAYVDFVKKILHELSDVPEGALGAMQPISNTSGVALHIQYQPLIGKTKRKKAQYEPGLEQVNYFILRIGMVKGQINLPFDLCKHCGGRIIEVEETDRSGNPKLTRIWNPETQSFDKVALRVKKCFHIDKQTLEFTDPYDMRVKYWRQYGFGSEIREMSYKDIKAEIEKERRSFWDYTVFQETQMAKWREDNQDAMQQAHTANIANVTPPEQKPVSEGLQAPEPQSHIPETPNALVPQVAAEPPKIEPPPMLKIMPMPIGEIDIPEEPVHVNVRVVFNHPLTGETLEAEDTDMFLVPMDCKRSQYLNPFENKVEFLDVLPKDEALQAQLYQGYQQSGWVDEEWCQDHISEIAKDAPELRRRMKKKKALEQRMQPAMMQQQQGGTLTVRQGELAPKDEQINQVPGPDGNPVGMNQQLGGPQQ